MTKTRNKISNDKVKDSAMRNTDNNDHEVSTCEHAWWGETANRKCNKINAAQ